VAALTAASIPTPTTPIAPVGIFAQHNTEEEPLPPSRVVPVPVPAVLLDCHFFLRGNPTSVTHLPLSLSILFSRSAKNQSPHTHTHIPPCPLSKDPFAHPPPSPKRALAREANRLPSCPPRNNSSSSRNSHPRRLRTTTTTVSSARQLTMPSLADQRAPVTHRAVVMFAQVQ